MTTTASMTSPVSAESVLAFLRANPDFLSQYPELLSSLPPEAASAGNVVDFQQLMVQKLRADKKSVEDHQRILVDNVRNNMTVQARIHAAVLRLLDSTNLDEMVEILSNELSLMLEVDVISVLLESHTPQERPTVFHGMRIVDPGFIDNHITCDRDMLLQSNVPGDPRIFGAASRLVKSQALIRLNLGADIPDGLLAFGSRDPLLFADGQGTELVGFLSGVTQRMLRYFLRYANGN